MATYRYKAFISYCHRDEKWARWLHRRMETYRVPKHLTGQKTSRGPVPARLKPLFRDREELSAADSLGTKIEEALAASENLILICSPGAAQSHWVNQEVLTFRRNNHDANIFCVIVDGEPYASDISGRETEECFPRALRYELDAAGELTDIRVAEPLAADLRSHADGKRLGMLKLISGMIGVRLDEIVQRDMQRARRRVTAITAGSLAAMLAMASLTGFALEARQEAETRRAEAEGLVEFMLGDLRDKLEPVGRLDVLYDAATKALDYYAQQDEDKLSCDGISSKARAYYVLARIHSDRQELDLAQTQADASLKTIESHTNDCMNEPRFIINYAHAQQWAVEPSWRRLKTVKKENISTEGKVDATNILESYKASKNTLEHLSSHNDWTFEYAMELIDVNILIGGVYSKMGQLKSAELAFDSAYRHINPLRPDSPKEEFGELSPEQQDRVVKKYADILSWQASVKEDTGDLEKALYLYELARSNYARLAQSGGDNSKNWPASYAALGADYSIARMYHKLEDFESAVDRVKRISSDLSPLLNYDPSNKEWQRFAAKVENTQKNMRK